MRGKVVKREIRKQVEKMREEKGQEEEMRREETKTR